MKTKKYTLDHEDILLCLQALFELVDELAEDLPRTAPEKTDNA
jgi:hypothetical protein